MVYLRWQLKYTSGWIEAPGYSRTCLFSFGPPPRLKGIMRLFILSDAVGVDGLTYLPSLPLLSLLDGLKPHLL